MFEQSLVMMMMNLKEDSLASIHDLIGFNLPLIPISPPHTAVRIREKTEDKKYAKHLAEI